MQKIILPKNYLSYSAMTMWLQNEARYRREYFEGGEKLDSKYLRFGKESARTRENRDVKPGEFPEYEIEVTIRGIPILAKIDFYDSNTHTFEEDKTGKHPWTRSRVQKHEQLPFYATVLRAKHGKMPEKCKLNWFETRDGKEGGLQNDIEFTGEVKSFEREFDESECDRIEDLILKVAEEISEAYQQYIKEQI
jgi:hypothetical protein